MTTNSDQLTVSTSVVALDASKYDPGTGRDKKAATATITSDGAIRYTVDPSLTPTASVGHKLGAGGQIQLTSENEIKNFRAIRDGSANAILDISYYRGE